jgi:hypothetical protein
MSQVLGEPIRVSFDYTRSLGSVMSRFMTGLRDGTVLGARLSDGRVACPPVEFDPITHAPVTEFVEVSTVGTVATWSWVSDPVEGQPFDRPFAFALITLDGADTPMLHAVDVASPAAMHTGMRVQVRWAADRVGHINDIACFEPATDSPTTVSPIGGDAVTGIVSPINLNYYYEASPEESKFYSAIAEGRLVGQRCPKCRKVYIPPRSACPVDGVPTDEEIDLPDIGTVTTYCVVNVPFLGQKIKPPYVSAYVLLDGADIAFLHLIQGIPADEVRMGMRVKAVWKPREEWTTSVENIEYFEPLDEPDAPYESYSAHL